MLLSQETGSSDTLNLSKSLGDSKNILSVLEKIQGPYSFIYLDAESHHLYFGRDRLGRHSLLWNYNCEGSIFLTSVAKRSMLDIKEVPAIGIFRFDLNVEGKMCVQMLRSALISG